MLSQPPGHQERILNLKCEPPWTSCGLSLNEELCVCGNDQCRLLTTDNQCGLLTKRRKTAQFWFANNVLEQAKTRGKVYLRLQGHPGNVFFYHLLPLLLNFPVKAP